MTSSGRPQQQKPVRSQRPMTPSSTPQKWEGYVYNAEDGKTYSGSFTLTGANTAELKGCVLGGLICKAQTWTRSN